MKERRVMTTEEILNGNFDSTEKIDRKELEDLIFSISKVRDIDKVDNIIKFINYCKEHRYDVGYYITSYFISLLDSMDSDSYFFTQRILLANKKEFDNIRKKADLKK